MTLLIGGDQLYARMQDGRVFNLDAPSQALLVVGEDLPLRPLTARERRKRVSGLERSSRRRRPDAR
jgi:hypothetical protein